MTIQSAAESTTVLSAPSSTARPHNAKHTTKRALSLSDGRESLKVMMSTHHDAYPAVDLFAGAGGLSLGLQEAGFATEVAAELDPDALNTYAEAHRRFSPSADLTLLDGDIQNHSFTRWRDQVALVAGGPPCQPYSLGGHRRGSADLRDGIPQFIRAVEEIRPDAFLMENVPGLSTTRHRSLLRDIISSLEHLKFTVDWRVLRAADYGVSQRRQRLFIVGTRRAGFEWPTPTHGATAGRSWVPAGKVISANNPVGEANSSKVTFARNPDLRPSPWDGHLWNGGGRPINLNGLAPTLLASMGGNKTPWVDTKGIVPEYHSHLLNGGLPRSGAVPGARRITVQEAAAIQTFPIDMPWQGARSSQYRQIGNAVPVKLAHAIGREVYRALAS